MRRTILDHVFQLFLFLTTLNNLPCQLLEYLINIFIIFGTNFYKFHIMFLGEHLSLLFCHFPVLLHVSLRSHQNHIRLCIPHLVYLVHPSLDVSETIWISD